jgi:WD40 repeat protein
MRAAVWVGMFAVLAGAGNAIAQESKPDILARLEGHRGGVSTMAFSPNPSRALALFATGAGNGVVRLWDAHSGKFLTQLDTQKHNGARINNLNFTAGGFALSSSSRNAVLVWGFSNPTPAPKKDLSNLKEFKKEKDEEEGEQEKEEQEPKIDNRYVGLSAETLVVFEDPLGPDPVKIGLVTGDGRRVYYAATEGARITVSSHISDPAFGSDTGDELNSAFTPWVMDAIPDRQSGLVAMYGLHKQGDKAVPAIAFVGLGEGRVIGRGVVRTPVTGAPLSISFAPDRRWLVACNGEDLMYWKVPGSQVVIGDPKFLANAPAYVAAAGSNNRVAFASPPEVGKTAKVTIVDLSSATPKVIATYSTDIAEVSALAFSADGDILAVADNVEGVVQLWGLGKK